MSQAQPHAEANNSTALIESLLPGYSGERMAEASRTPETMATLRFMVHFWSDLPNSALAGYNFGVHHYILPRATLIPIRPWEIPVILPRVRGMAFTSFTPDGGAFPSGGVGSKVDKKWQYPAVSVQNLLGAYGKDSYNDIGMVELSSLKSESDLEKLEAVLLFKGVMETTDSDGNRGKDLPVETLLTWLNDGGQAFRLLQKALNSGVTAKAGVPPYELNKKTASERGRQMIKNMLTSCQQMSARALSKNTGILEITKADLIAAGKGQKDVKMRLDGRDEFLLEQFPTYSLDTDVERATRANRSVTDAITETGKESNTVLLQMAEQNAATQKMLAESQAQTAQVMQMLLKAQEEKSARDIGLDAVPANTVVDNPETTKDS